MLNVNDLKLDRFEIIDELDLSDSATKEKVDIMKTKVLRQHMDILNTVISTGNILRECTYLEHEGFTLQYENLDANERTDGGYLYSIMKTMCDIMCDVQYYEEELALLKNLTRDFKFLLGVTVVGEDTFKHIYNTAESMFNHVYGMLYGDESHIKAFSELYEPHFKFKIVLA